MEDHMLWGGEAGACVGLLRYCATATLRVRCRLWLGSLCAAQGSPVHIRVDLSCTIPAPFLHKRGFLRMLL